MNTVDRATAAGAGRRPQAPMASAAWATRPPRPATPGSPGAAAAGEASVNRAALREREWLASKLEAPLQHVAAPPPLHDFSHDDDDAFDRVLAKSGVPGRRLLRLPADVAPQHALACENEPEGPRTNPDSVEKVLEERGGLLVYRCTFQDLPPCTPAAVTQRLDRQRADAAPGQENPTALRQFYAPESPDDTVLVFESRFESGNLHSAHQVAPFEYDLKLSTDTNTNGHTQWFYFSVSNTRKGIPYKFNITNMLKPDSLYNHGLKPLMYSLKRQREESTGWHRTGEQILYYANRISAARKRGTCCYTLTFTVTFAHDHDTCYLSHCYPYTYCDLQTFLDQLELNPECRSYVRRKVLCETEAGNKCDVLTITSRSGDESEMKKRKGVIISARVHPGETNASWMMKGCIDFLLSDAEEARALRRKFVFKIVPMLCPDGVINGNYRCGIAGHDMNRRWAKPHPKQHSPIFHMKLMIEEMMQDRQVVLFCDLHGHSRKKNVFLYGCDARFWNRKSSSAAAPVPLSERVFPMLMDEKSQSFAFRGCRFKVQKSKSSTGRVVCWRQMGIHNSYTVEASFCSSDSGDKVGLHFDIPELERVGKCLCLTILEQFGGANQDALLERVQSEPLPQVDDGDSDSDDSSSDDEVVPVKTPSKTKSSRSTNNARSPERPSSVAETREKDAIKEPVQTITVQSSRRLQPRAKCARTTYRTGSHRRPTLSARARTAEPRSSDSMTAHAFKDKLRDWDVIPRVHVSRETLASPALRESLTNVAQSGGSLGSLDSNPTITPEEPRSMLRMAAVHAEEKAETLRDKKTILQGHFQRRAKEVGSDYFDTWSSHVCKVAHTHIYTHARCAFRHEGICVLCLVRTIVCIHVPPLSRCTRHATGTHPVTVAQTYRLATKCDGWRALHGQTGKTIKWALFRACMICNGLLKRRVLKRKHPTRPFTRCFSQRIFQKRKRVQPCAVLSAHSHPAKTSSTFDHPALASLRLRLTWAAPRAGAEPSGRLPPTEAAAERWDYSGTCDSAFPPQTCAVPPQT